MCIVAQKAFGFVLKTPTTCCSKFVEELAAEDADKNREKTDSSEYSATEPGEDEDEAGLQRVAEAARRVLLRPGSSPPRAKADPKQAPRKKTSGAALAAKTSAAEERPSSKRPGKRAAFEAGKAALAAEAPARKPSSGAQAAGRPGEGRE